MLVAQISEGQLQLGGLFNGLKVEIDEYKEVIDNFKELNLSDKKYKLNGKANWDAITEAIGDCDETALSYFKTLDDGKGTINNQSASVEGLNEYLQKTGQSFDTAALKAKALNVALNVGIMLAVTVAVKALSAAWDAFNVTVEEQQEKISNLTSEIETLQQEYDELSSKQSITKAEQERLDYLERRLELDKAILEAETRDLYKEQRGSKWNPTDWFDSDSNVVKSSKEFGGGFVAGWYNISALTDGYKPTVDKAESELNIMNQLKGAYEYLAEEQKKYAEGSAEYNDIQSQMDYNLESQTYHLENMEKSYDKLTEKQDEYLVEAEKYKEQIDSGLLSGNDLDEAQDIYSQWKDAYENVKTLREDIGQIIGKNNTNSEEDDVQNNKNSQEKIDYYNSLNEEIQQAIDVGDIEFSVEDSLEDCKAKVEEWKTSVESEEVVVDIVTSMDTLKEGFQSGFEEIYNSIQNKKTIDASALMSFSDDIKGLDGFTDFVNTMTDTTKTAEEQQEALNLLATEYINSSTLIENLTKENAEWTVAQLEACGVMNATEVVYSRLGLSLDNMKSVTETLDESLINLGYGMNSASGAGNNLQSISQADAKALVTEANAAGYTNQQLLAYISSKARANGQLNTSASCSALYAIASAAGVASSALTNYYNALSNNKGSSSGNYQADQAKKNDLESQFRKQLSNDAYQAQNAKVQYGTTTGGSGGGGSKSKSSKTEIDWIARKLEQLQKKIDLTKAKFENLFSLKTKSSNLDTQIKQTTKLLEANSKAADKYIKKATSYAKSSGLSKSLQKAVQEGRLDKYSLKDLIKKYGENTANKINQYKEYYDNYQEALKQVDELTTEIRNLKEQKYQLYVDDAEENIDKLNALGDISSNYKKSNSYLDKQKEYLKTSYEYQIKIAELTKDETKKAQLQAEYQKELRNLEKQKFDNIQDYYENQIELLNSVENAIQDQADLLETKGMTVNAKYYTDQVKYEKQKQVQLKKSKTELEAQLKSIVYGTDEWYEAKSAIAEVNSELIECEKTIAEMNSSVTDLADNFQSKMMGVGNTIMNTMDWAVNLMSNVDTFNSETGVMTKEGFATLGSYVSGYNTSGAMSESYRKLVANLESNYNKGILSFTDPNGMKRDYNSLEEFKSAIDETYEEWRDQISTTYDYESKIIDMMKEKLENELSALKDLIDAKKNALDAEKTLHDYQKSISESTQNITSLEKQIAALQGDDSAETAMRIQKLQKELTDAQDDLQEKEYDRYISDQEEMLDKLYDEYESFLQSEILDVKHLLAEGIAIAQSMSGSIEKTVSDYVKPYDYNGRFDSLDMAIKNITDDSDTSIASQIKKIANEGVNIINPSSNENTSNTSNTNNSNASLKSEEIQTSPNIPAKILTIGGQNNTLEALELSAIEKLKSQVKAVGIKVKGFKSGGIGKVIKPQDEDGLTWVKNGEGFVAPEDVPHIQELLKTVPAMNDMLQPLVSLPTMPNIQPISTTGNVSVNIDNIALPNVTNSEEFTKQLAHTIQNDSKIQKLMRTTTVNAAMGGSRLATNKYKF